MKNSKQNMMKMLPALAVSLLMAGMFAGCGGADVAKESVPASTVSASAKAEANESKASDVQKGAPMEQLQTTTYEVNGVAFKMVLVEGGTFRMGSDDRNVEFSESPAHNVTLTKDYLIGETEVTQALWNAVTGRSTSKSTLPQTSVTWEDAHAFVDRLNEIAHAQGIIAPSQSFCLPTEAQWEYAAKGGNKSKGYRYSGSNDINDVAVTRENSGSDHPSNVKTKQPNELGIYDMSGNAYEWVDDYAGSYSAEDQVDPQNTTPSGRYVKRGGSNYHRFGDESYLFTTTGRYFYGSTDWTIGFRLALVNK